MGADIPLADTLLLAIGLLWPISALLLVLAGIFYFLKKDWWPGLAILGALLSQLLIILHWEDSKFGTFFNVLVLVVSIPAYRKFSFRRKARREAAALLSKIEQASEEVISEEKLQTLPEIVQKWLKFSEVTGKKEVNALALRQRGMMRTKPSGNWMPFSAVQYFDVKEPAFLWLAEVSIMPLIYLLGKDRLENAEGEMYINLLTLINLVKEKKSEKINSGAMLRFLAEMSWFPSAALNPYLSWEAIGSASARAHLRHNGREVSGVFNFHESGELKSFEALRFYGAGKDAKEEKWQIEILDFKHFSGRRIPYRCKVTWKLPSGDFNWLNLEITDLEYNPQDAFEEIKQREQYPAF
ncbi:MAG: DUF6544 family protein [Salegentibacter sp.]